MTMLHTKAQCCWQ